MTTTKNHGYDPNLSYPCFSVDVMYYSPWTTTLDTEQGVESPFERRTVVLHGTNHIITKCAGSSVMSLRKTSTVLT